jgi:hypothetical protein
VLGGRSGQLLRRRRSEWLSVRDSVRQKPQNEKKRDRAHSLLFGLKSMKTE